MIILLSAVRWHQSSTVKPYCCGFFSLTGTEPWHYYFVNGFLNFNIVFLLALFSLPLTALMEALLQRFNGKKE